MFSRDRLYQFAVRGCLIGLILLSGPALSQTYEGVEKAAAENAEANQPVTPTAEESDALFWDYAKGKPEAYRAICEKPTNRNDADLCQQWRMAKAANEQADWTRRQYYATIVEIIALVAAVIVAALAALAASRAAQATAETVGAMRRSERAYVTISHHAPGLDLVTHTGYAKIAFEIKNFGRTPATVTNILLKLDWFGKDAPAPDRPPYGVDEPQKKGGVFLVTQAHSKHSATLKIPNEGEGNELWLYGYVDYTDEFGQSHRSGYARVYRDDDENNLVFVDKAGWNYDCLRPCNGDNKTKGNDAG